MTNSLKPELARQIAESIKEVCEHDINFISVNGIIFASTNPKRIGDYHEIGKTAARTAKTIEVTASQSTSGVQKGVNIPFLFHGEVLAVIGISGNPDEVRQYARLAQRITTLLLREHELELQEQRQKAELHQLLRAFSQKEPVPPGYIKTVLSKYPINQTESYRSARIQIQRHSWEHAKKSSEAVLENRLEALFLQAETPLYTALSYEEYFLLFEDKKFNQLLSLFQKWNDTFPGTVKIGIGKAETLLSQHQSADTALLSLNSLGKDDFLAVYDHLTLELLLNNVSDPFRQAYLAKTCAPLDEKKKELLKTYFASNSSLKTTCELLFIHKNTLQYQLDRIHQITGLNPRNFQDAVILYLALKLENTPDSV